MGGLSKHMMHIYDNYHLTKDEVVDIINNIARGDMKFKEKIDGFNIHVAYDTQTHTLRFYRNKKDILSGGMTISDMKGRWCNKPDVLNIYIKAAELLTSPLCDRLYVLTSTTGVIRTLNIECVCGLTNVIPYDGNFICIHNQWEWDAKTGEVIGVNQLPNYISYLGLQNYHIYLPQILDPIPNNPKYNINNWISLMSSYINEFLGMMGSCNTLYEYYYTSFINYCDTHLEHSWIIKDDEMIRDVFERIFFNNRSVNLKKITDHYYYNYQIDSKYIKSWLEHDAKNIRNACMKSMKIFFIRFGNCIMDNLQGYINYKNRYFISDIIMRRYVKRCTEVYNEANKHSNPNIFRDNIYNINDLIQSTGNQFNALEGVVFEYKDNMYKLTGSFAPINQIMWYK